MKIIGPRVKKSTTKPKTVSETPSETIPSESEQTTPRKKYQKSQKFKRWGRENDKIAFNILREFLDKANITQTEFFVDPKFEFEGILIKISRELNWLRSPETLYARMFRTFQEAKSFSVRKLKLLNKLVEGYRSIDEVVFEDIMPQFPGATLEYIRVEVSRIFNSR